MSHGTLLRLRLRELRNLALSAQSSSRVRALVVSLITAVVLLAEGWAAVWIFDRLRLHEDLSELFVLALVERLLSLVFLTSLSMLVLSNAITGLQTLFLSRDLPLLAATPVAPTRIFGIKFVETVLLSSYMVVAFTLPILVGYGLSFDAGPLFYVQLLPTLAVYVLAPAGLGVAVTLLLMRLVSARQAQQALSVITLGAGVSIVVLLRMTQPERLLRPSGRDDLAAFLRSITLPAADLLPSSWAARLQMAAIGGDHRALGLNALLLLAAATLGVGLALLAAWRYYADGLSGVGEGRRRRGGGPAVIRLGLVGRDLRLFFRDASQWSQLLLLGALVVIYVFNMTALPADLLVVGELKLGELIAWLNGALASLVLAALGLRFVLPSTSLEGGAFWVVASSPLERRRYVLRKLLFFLPLVGFAELLVLLSNLVLDAAPAIMALTAVSVAVASVALIALGVGLGAAYPVFRLDNPAQIMFTTGGLLYGVGSLAYVVALAALEAPVVVSWLLLGGEGLGHTLWWLVTAGLLSLLVGGLPLWWGIRRLERIEV